MDDYNESTAENEEYWVNAMKYRMEDYVEVWRLHTSLKGFYYQHLLYEAAEGTQYKEHKDILEFLNHNKRPFGNKNIEQSVIFNLGWDTQWRMREQNQPFWVEVEVEKLLVLLRIEVEDSLSTEGESK